MRSCVWACFVVAALSPDALAFDGRFRVCGPDEVTKLNKSLAGQVLDFTSNHGVDRRMHSLALKEKRDLYVYLPPGYDGRTPFPFMMFLHGLGQDEKIFLDVIVHFDEAIRKGEAAPMVIACPDGSVGARPSLIHTGSFYLNSEAGRFGDYIMDDVWDFAHEKFALRPERDAHVIAGASMGGFGAFNIAFKQRERYGQIVGIMPPLNLRYGDLDGHYLTKFSPTNFALRPVNRRNELIGKFYGVVLIRSRRIMDPLVGRWSPDATAFVSRENPYEMLTSYSVKPGEFNIFIGYGKKDEFNLDAEIESFLAEAKRLEIPIDTLVLPDGRHNIATAVKMIPAVNAWLLERVGPYAPANATSPRAPTAEPPRTARPGLRLARRHDANRP